MGAFKPVPTAVPTAVITSTPVPTPVITATPAPYTGYALTLRAVDLRTGVKPEDTTLATLPAHTLVFLWGQAYIDGACWHSAEALQLGISGYLPDSVLQRISVEDAAPYLSALQPKATPTPKPTPQPEPFTGYAVTNGNNVLMRAYANTSAEILKVLPADEVVWVVAQEYTAGEQWQIVRYNQIYGYIRGDQLRMMSYEDSIMYEESLRTATPAPAPTPTVAPITQESLSSYGYVTTNNVRLRSGAGTNTDYIRMMNRYAFALVLGTEEVDGKIWYHINQAGAEGYVMGDYFKVLSLGELQHFLTSDEYLQSQDTPSGSGSGTLTSPEDFNQNIWQNPAVGDVPTFNPSVFWTPVPTATVNVEAIATPSPTPTVSVLPTTNFEPYVTPSPNAGGGSGSGIIWLAVAGLGIIAGGGVYAYSIHRQNQRRAAQNDVVAVLGILDDFEVERLTHECIGVFHFAFLNLRKRAECALTHDFELKSAFVRRFDEGLHGTTRLIGFFKGNIAGLERTRKTNRAILEANDFRLDRVADNIRQLSVFRIKKFRHGDRGLGFRADVHIRELGSDLNDNALDDHAFFERFLFL